MRPARGWGTAPRRRHPVARPGPLSTAPPGGSRSPPRRGWPETATLAAPGAQGPARSPGGRPVQNAPGGGPAPARPLQTRPTHRGRCSPGRGGARQAPGVLLASVNRRREGAGHRPGDRYRRDGGCHLAARSSHNPAVRARSRAWAAAVTAPGPGILRGASASGVPTDCPYREHRQHLHRGARPGRNGEGVPSVSCGLPLDPGQLHRAGIKQLAVPQIPVILPLLECPRDDRTPSVFPIC
ncbi:translation initiation factor IF-2-like [Falco biarmicus]|uniref:translation initiation factor IF-2-like n=1 Tax=Falco cherrug TaxID=345164 RepID=UPI002479E94B|nr:translation initiation factor IF-2-like [Falco cherrug]XP_056195924.1 translation initiation factor IF-2-like [Falco biarmicus]